MNAHLATATAWSYGLAGVGYAVFALQLGFGWRAGGLRGMVLLWAVALSALWGLAGLAYALSNSHLMLSFGVLADLLRFACWDMFLLALTVRPRLGQHGQPSRRPLWLALLAAGLLIISVIGAGMIALRVNAFQDPGRVVMLISLAMAVFGLVLVEQLFRNVAAGSQASVKPLCLGLAAVLVFDLYLYANALLADRLDQDAWSARGFVHALVIPLVAMSIARSRDGAFAIELSRRFVFHLSALLGSLGYLVLVLASAVHLRELGGEIGRSLELGFVFAALLALALLGASGSARAKLRVIVNKHFFSYRYDYREEWLRFTRALSLREEEGEAVGRQVVKGLADMVESPGGELWLREAGGRFVPRASWNAELCDAVEEADGALVTFMTQRGWVINLEEFRSSPGRYGDLVLPQWLSRLAGAWLVVPLAADAGLIGFVVLKTARTPIDVNWEVSDLLKTAGRQAGTFLGQLQATEALLEARKFDSFNRMSAFVVHDLKNIVSQLSLMLKNAERHRAKPEFQQDMLMTIEHSVERMNRLLMQLRVGTTPAEAPRGVDMTAIIRRIQHAKGAQRPPIELQLEHPAMVLGHEERLERVIGHLVQNALDATGEHGRIWVRLARQSHQAMVEVGDSGHGMSTEFMQQRLFKPFQTTKEAGMGIGAYESFQYIQELGGRVLVDSTPNVGTRVRILLPLHGSGAGAPDIAREATA